MLIFNKHAHVHSYRTYNALILCLYQCITPTAPRPGPCVIKLNVLISRLYYYCNIKIKYNTERHYNWRNCSERKSEKFRGSPTFLGPLHRTPFLGPLRKSPRRNIKSSRRNFQFCRELQKVRKSPIGVRKLWRNFRTFFSELFN